MAGRNRVQEQVQVQEQVEAKEIEPTEPIVNSETIGAVSGTIPPTNDTVNINPLLTEDIKINLLQEYEFTFEVISFASKTSSKILSVIGKGLTESEAMQSAVDEAKKQITPDEYLNYTQKFKRIINTENAA